MNETGDTIETDKSDDSGQPSTSRQRRLASSTVPNLSSLSSNVDELNNNYKAKDMRDKISKNETQSNGEMTRDEYTASLNQWVNQCYCWQYFRSMNYFMFMASNPGLSTPVQHQRPFTATVTVTQTISTGRIYLIPKLWKRAVAELIDFVFLLVLKVMITYIVLDHFEFIDQNKYDFSLDEEFDAYHLAYEWSSEIIIIELMHRFIVVVFETLFLSRRRNANSPGGATPGKMCLGLKVVSCSQVNDMGNGVVQVLPAEDIGLWRSLLRAVIKNVSSVFFLPTSLTVFISNHNRAAYDFASKSIVVEEPITSNAQRRRN